MKIKKLILPLLCLFILGQVSYANKYPFKFVRDFGEKVMCEGMGPKGEDIEIFDLAKIHINNPAKVHLITECCLAKPKKCKNNRMVDGNYIIHMMAYHGYTKEYRKLKEARVFMEPRWQVVNNDHVEYATVVHYSAEQNQVETLKETVKLGESAHSVRIQNADGKPLPKSEWKKPIDLTTNNEIKTFLKGIPVTAADIDRAYKGAAHAIINYALNDKATIERAFSMAAEHFKSLGFERFIQESTPFYKIAS